MTLIAIDTALDACSVAVLADDRQPVLFSEKIGKGHAERLMPMIQSALVEAGAAPASVRRIAVTVGPGSFTGVRVGIAAARGLALATGAALSGIGTLAVLAGKARRDAGPMRVFAALDARRGEIYGQLFDASGAAETPPEVATAREFAARLPQDASLAGSGAAAIAAITPRPILHADTAPEVAALLALAERAAPDATPPVPLYLRPPDARPQDAARVARR